LGFERSQPEKKPFLQKKHSPQEMVNHHAIADLKLVVFRSNLDDLAHGLMTEDVALFHRGHDAVEQVEVRTADRAGGDLDDGIASVLDLGIRYRVAPNVVLAVPGQRSHSNLLAAICVETNSGGKISSLGSRNDN
jgi:hypothetical protein